MFAIESPSVEIVVAEKSSRYGRSASGASRACRVSFGTGGSVRPVLFGAHCSGGIKKALDRAAEIGADSLQLFAQSPRMWRFPNHDPADLAAFRERRRELGIGAVVVHALYLVNLASPNDEFYEKSVATMRSTMDAASAIEADGVIFHVGSHQGAGFEAGLERVVPALAQVLERARTPRGC